MPLFLCVKLPLRGLIRAHCMCICACFSGPVCTELSNHNRNTEAWQRYHRNNYLISEHVIIIPP